MVNNLGSFAVATLALAIAAVRGDLAAQIVSCPVDSKGSVTCPSSMEWKKDGCYCRYDMQFLAKGVCVGVSGAQCGGGNGCMYGSTCVSNNCRCNDSTTEDIETGYCVSPISGSCFDRRNCAMEQDCVNGKCQCGFGKVYNSASNRCECTAPATKDSNTGYCISPFGGPCGDSKNCARGFSCINGTCGCDFGQEYGTMTKTCECKSDTSRDWRTESCRGRFGSSCADKRHCAEDMDCMSGKCACGFGKIYNSDYVLDYYQRYSFTPTDVCQIPLGGRCDRKQDDGRFFLTKNRVCITNNCDWSSKKCECWDSAVPDKTGTNCECAGASYVGSRNNYCIPYLHAIEDSSGMHVCPDGTTKNSTTHSCECTIKGSTYDDALGTCDCGLSSALNQTTNECQCKGHSVMDIDNNKCKAFGNAQYDDNAKVYACPYDTHANEQTGNCDCNDPNKYYGSYGCQRSRRSY